MIQSSGFCEDLFLAKRNGFKMSIMTRKKMTRDFFYWKSLIEKLSLNLMDLKEKENST